MRQDSQYLFAYEDLTQKDAQLTWTDLPQGFRGSLPLFSQALAKDLLDFKLSKITVLCG